MGFWRRDGRCSRHSHPAELVIACLAFAFLAMSCRSAGRPERANGGHVPEPDSGHPEAAESLPFVQDDYPRALAEAKSKRKPLFVDAWAPWCHSCLSMRAYVLNDPSLAPLANDFVWLALDTEKESNAAFVERFPQHVWPTLWIIDPANERTLLRWEGTATAPELVTLLKTVALAGEAHAEDGGAPHAPARAEDAAESTMMFLRANQASARGDVARAEAGYREVLGRPDFTERPRAVEALVGLLAAKKDDGVCTDVARDEAKKMPPGTSRATVLGVGLSCARQAKRTADLRELVELATRVANDPDPRTAPDDRSALFEELVETKKEQGDPAGAKAIAETWRTLLKNEMSRAPTKRARAVFDAHLLAACIAAGVPQAAHAELVESTRDFPDDYNTWARLARLDLEEKHFDLAKEHIELAAKLVYGPRALRVFALAADIAKARGATDGERAALEQALSRTSNTILNENQKKLRASLEERLRALPAAPAAGR